MKDAIPGTYSVKVRFTGAASISVGSGEPDGNNAQAVLRFNGATPTTLLMSGSVSLARNGRGRMAWPQQSKDVTVTIVVKNRMDRVQIGNYDVSMNGNECPGAVTVTATGTIKVLHVDRVK
jgi:hypothetical protein